MNNKIKYLFVFLLLILVHFVSATEYIGEISTNVPIDNEIEEVVTIQSSSSSGGGGGKTPSTVKVQEVKEIDTTNIKQAPIEPPKTKHISNNILNQNIEISLKEKETVNFEIEEETHSLVINEITDNSITFTLRSEPIIDTIKVSQVKKYDLDRNGFNDIEVYLKSIQNQKADLEINLLLQPKGNNGITGAVVGLFGKGSSQTGLIGIVILIIVLATLVIYRWKRRSV